MIDIEPPRRLARVLRAVVELKRAELAQLETALDVVERSATNAPSSLACAQAPQPTARATRARPPIPCYGALATRHCFGCGRPFSRCEQHGGSRGATHALQQHARECGTADAVEAVLARGLVVEGRPTP